MNHPFFIVNPRSAGGTTSARWTRRVLPLALERFGAGLRWEFTAGPGDAARLAARERAAGSHLIVIVGGDGTLSEAVAGLLRAPGAQPMPLLGLVPAGTGSDFARTLGVPSRPAAALELLDTGRVVSADACEITCGPAASAVRQFSINVCGCGIPGEVVRRVNGSRRRRPAVLAFLSAALAALSAYRPQETTVAIDGGPPSSCRLLALFVCNGRYFGGGMQPGRAARIDDGLLRVVEVSAMSRARILTRLHRLYTGRLEGVEGVRVTNGRCVEVCGSPDVLVEADGEQPGTLPARFTVLPGALRVIGKGSRL